MVTRIHPWPARLSYRQRWAVTERVARRHRKKLLSFPNVVAVGVGLEWSGKRGKRGRGRANAVRIGTLDGYREYVPCVHVVVKKKWTTQLTRKGILPDTISTRAKVGRSTIRVAVPVDVVEQRPSKLHSWECDVSQGAATLIGSGSCFVRLQGDRKQYLLGCHHVLALTDIQPPPIDFGSVSVAWESTALGSLALLPRNVNDVDAALANSDGRPQAQFSADGGTIVIRGALQPNEPPPPQYFILTRHGVRRAELQAIVAHTENYYGNNTPLTFESVLHSLVEQGESQLQPADSGAPLVAPDGRLIGIHYAGDVPSGPDSYALRADIVLGAFVRTVSVW